MSNFAISGNAIHYENAHIIYMGRIKKIPGKLRKDPPTGARQYAIVKFDDHTQKWRYHQVGYILHGLVLKQMVH